MCCYPSHFLTFLHLVLTAFALPIRSNSLDVIVLQPVRKDCIRRRWTSRGDASGSDTSLRLARRSYEERGAVVSRNTPAQSPERWDAGRPKGRPDWAYWQDWARHSRLVCCWLPAARGEGQERQGRCSAPAIPVGVATAKQGDFDVYLTGLGSVTALNTVSLKTRIDGQIMQVNFREGRT